MINNKNNRFEIGKGFPTNNNGRDRFIDLESEISRMALGFSCKSSLNLIYASTSAGILGSGRLIINQTFPYDGASVENIPRPNDENQSVHSASLGGGSVGVVVDEEATGSTR
ncbi:hypothetical protein Tco_0153269 [Tanacetum coccineum]